MRSALSPQPFAQKLAVIGDPIAHSLSPKLQNFLIRHFALPFTYEALHVRQNDLPEIIQRLRGGEFWGINVTLPHKQAVLPFLDAIDETAAKIGAINTIVVEAGRLSGYNTDVFGFLRNLEAAGIAIAVRNAFVLGAGGAARAVIFALLQARAGRIWLCNRSADRGNALMAAFAQHAEMDRLQSVAWLDRIDWLKQNPVHIVINTTSVGMHPRDTGSPLPKYVFSSQMVAVDLVYNPFQTVFLQAASAAGAKIVNGLGMLIYQGVAALELWSQQKLDIRDIYPRLEQELTRALNS